MKTKIWIVALLAILSTETKAETNVQGNIIETKYGYTVIRLYGTHHARGYAYGYLLGDKISEACNTYLGVISKCKYKKLRTIISKNVLLNIDDCYLTECKAIIEGMNDASKNNYKYDHIDLLIANSLFDLKPIQCLSGVKTFGCSSLISWGEATKGTDLDGISVITRNFDWFNNKVIVKNQVLVIHIPTEKDEQPWLNIGVAGQIGITSGINQKGLSAFIHAVPFAGGKGSNDNTYEPVLLALRKGLEKKDYNKDGTDDILDIKSAILSNSQGYAEAFIISAVGPAIGRNPEQIAFIAEITPDSPKFTFRSTEYYDKIPNDNLYAANSLLKRKQREQHGKRNKIMVDSIGSGNNISSDKNLALLRDYSRFKVPFDVESNIQFMQYIPEWNILKLSISLDKSPAYLIEPVEYDLCELFRVK